MSDDYDINGVNISVVVKNQRKNYGWIRLYNLIEKYDVKIMENKNNLILLKIGDDLFYYALVKQKIRLKGSNEWDSKIVSFLKKHFNNNIPLKKVVEIIENNDPEIDEYLNWVKNVDINSLKYPSSIRFVNSVKNNKSLSVKQLEILKDIKNKNK